MPYRAKSRLARALRGDPSSPPVTGLTFVPVDAVASVVPDCSGASEILLAAADALSLDFIFVPAAAEWAREVADCRGRTSVMWVVDGPLWPALEERASLTDALAATVRDPSSFTPTLEKETQRAASLVREGVRLSVDAVVIAEDLAGKDGLLVTPGFLESQVMPRLAKVAGCAEGTPVLLHSDGDICSILPSVRKAGFAGVHAGALDRDAFEALFWQARRNSLAVLGGVQRSSLVRGTPAAVRAGTQAALLAQAGGLLVADDGGISSGDEMRAFAGALRAARGRVVPRDA